MEPRAVTEHVFVLTVKDRERDVAHVGVVYTALDKPEANVPEALQEVVRRQPGPLMMLGDFNKDAL